MKILSITSVILLLSLAFSLSACQRNENSGLEEGREYGEAFGEDDAALEEGSLAEIEKRLSRWQNTWTSKTGSTWDSLKRSLKEENLGEGQLENAEALYRRSMERLSNAYDEILRNHPELRQPLEAIQNYSEQSDEYKAAKKVLAEKLPSLLGPAWEK